MTLALAKPPSDLVRVRELGAIHAARRQLALHEDSYRAIISRFSKGRTESSKDLKPGERRDVIDYFRSIGFKRTKPKTKVDRRADYRPQAQKLKALWFALYQLGIVRDPDQEALEAFVCRHTDIMALRWNFPSHLDKAIECLKAWCARVGYVPKPFKDDLPSPQQGSFRPGLILTQWGRLAEIGAPAPTLLLWMRGLGINVDRVTMLSDEQADEVIRALGRFLRASDQGSPSASRGQPPLAVGPEPGGRDR